MSASRTLLLEISLEVCNQVGGIYTVLRTKAASTVPRLNDRYVLIGPYYTEKAALEFEEEAPPDFIAEALREELESRTCRWGRWLVPGEPQTLLLSMSQPLEDLNRAKFLLWEDYGISTLQPDSLIDEAITFGVRAADVVHKLSRHSEAPVIAHAHEWLAGVSLLHGKARDRTRVKTVFTTHATLIGRYEAGNNPEFYRHLESIDAGERAQHYGITARHQIERASAQEADVFTTVSEVTGREAALFLGRPADAILPNGLNVHHFTALHEFQNLHLQFKQRIHEFVMGHFFPYYSFDLDRTLYFFTSGRYEYRNKGMDIFIDALSDLRARLRRLPDPPTVVAFIITKAPSKEIKADVLKGRLMFHDLQQLTETLKHQIGERLLDSMLHGNVPSGEDLLPTDATTRIKRACHAFNSQGLPPVVTHTLLESADDPVLAHLHRKGFHNAKDDPVKIVFHPDFITATSPLFGLEYDQFVRGCHLGIFPSYYEPWGYTPLECIALGLPAVTTDLSGSGSFVRNSIPNAWENGIVVLNRSTKTDVEAASDLAVYLGRFCQLSRRERIDLRNRAERLTENFDWSSLSNYYFAVYDQLMRSA